MNFQQPFTDITSDEYQSEFADRDHLLLDVRELEEYVEGHLPNAVNLPLSELQARVGEVGQDKPLVIVCRSGGRSAMAAEFFAALGYGELYNLEGGTMGWARKGLPLSYPE